MNQEPTRAVDPSAAAVDARPTAENGRAAEPDTPRSPGPRRRSRGGRGRGGRGSGSTAKAAKAANAGKAANAAKAANAENAANAANAENAANADLDRAQEAAVQAQGASTEPQATERAPDSPETVDEASSPSAAPRKRRRRGGRGRGRGRKPAQSATDPSGSPEEAQAERDGGGEETPPKPRSARARKPAAKKTEPASDGDGAATKTRARTAAKVAEPEATPETPRETGSSTEEAAPAPRKRRRRGGRGRGRKKPVESQADEGAVASSRPTARTAAKRATSAPAKEDAQVSTRLRRARQSRQTRTGSRRRREPLPVVPRITDKLMVITEHGERDQIAVLEGRDLAQHYVTRIGARSMVGNVYLGRVQNVLPGMEAAFIDVGRGRNAVLYAGEVNYSPEDLEGSPPRIEKVLRSGQSVLVQVTKDPIGGKGARLTAQISMPGRYLVLVPNSNVTGISRRLPEDERKRLKTIYKKIKPDPHGLIVRTAAEGASEAALAADLQRLLDEWAAIEKRAKKAKAPAILYEEPELTVRVVRDLFTDEEYRELVTDSPRVYQIVTDYLHQADPEVVSKVRLHEGKLPAFEEFHVVEQIHKGLDRKVWLPSGGYIVIDRTEALTVIDVNTGKSVGKTNLEETVVNTNLEAAREVARQLRLRDIGGMIVIDMIDMLLEQNKKKVIETLREALAQDKSRSQVFDISPLGLLEVTRKRVSGGLLESFSETCPTCEGRGVLLTYDVD
ncbi:MAG TPA: Rne/Rng family ribonuclease [Actinomycetota bacterium]|nr:Rne/Rng family ribonuclease [Actinomycetota bacterium]